MMSITGSGCELSVSGRQGTPQGSRRADRRRVLSVDFFPLGWLPLPEYRNAEFLEDIAACGGLPFTIDESVATSTSSTSNDASATSTSATTSADQSQDRLRSTLRQFIRDWSAAGARERQECYGPVLEALEERWPDQMERKGRKVLVPGAGLGRLALEVAGRGEHSEMRGSCRWR